MTLLNDLWRDAALGIRLLTRYPGFSAVSIATLAVAIGGNTAVFSVVNALLLTPPAIAEPERVVRIYTGQSLASWPNYEDIRARTDVFAEVFASRVATMSLERNGAVSKLRGQLTSTNYLTALGVPAALGRAYAANDSDLDRIVLAHHVWRQHFGSAPDILDRPLTMAGRTVRVAGVMPPGYRGLAPPGIRVDFWVPVEPRSAGAALRNRSLPQIEIGARLRPGVLHLEATAALRLAAARMRADHPELPASFLQTEAMSFEGFNAFRGMASILLPVFAFLVLLTVVSGFVLVIGCSNIAGLLVGRAAMRQREIGVRLALGSSRGRLLRQLLTESLVLALAGGAAGLLVALGIVTLLQAGVARLPAAIDLEIALDRRVLAYVIGLSTATSLFFGLLPARGALRLDLVTSLKAESSGSPARQRLRRALVTGQVAVCSALIVWSGLFFGSLTKIHEVNPGFEAAGVLLATVELDRASIDAGRADEMLTAWTQRVGGSPGVQSAALAMIVPLALTGREEFRVSLPGDPDSIRRRVVANRLSPGWFGTVRIPLVAGRDFSWNDRRGTPDVVIVNETLARQYWNGAALGQRLVFGERTLEVIGVAKDSKYRTLGEDVLPQVYLPLRQFGSDFVVLHVRTSDPRATAAVAAREWRQLSPDADVEIQSMTDAVAVAVVPAQIGAAATGGFGVLAIALAAFGVYGLVSFSVLQRAREIGIRRAVGATSADIVRLVLRQHGTLIAAGLAIGLAVGSLGGVALRAFLTGVGPANPAALIGAVALVAGAAVAASVIPARRATRLDPMAALRDM